MNKKDQRFTLPSGYRFDSATGCWLSDVVRDGFDYSDGDAIERGLLETVRSANDLTSVSAELRTKVVDWPSRYHLSPARGNLLRPFVRLLQGRTLEIGAGCGAISRFIGECGGQLHSLEGSALRAQVAAARCRDLPNVAVAVDVLDRFPAEQSYDVVVLVGVLEYARKYFPGGGIDPVDALLRRTVRYLKPQGVVMLAIENQLGLKYLAGFDEDHYGLPMYGVEDQYDQGGVVTFGRGELKGRLSAAGMVAQQWWYPFPDYKLPSLVLDERALADSRMREMLPLICSAQGMDPQKPATPRFRLERAWGTVMRNGIGPDLANSFLVLAGAERAGLPKMADFAFHFAADRRREYAKQVIFSRSRDATIGVRQELMYPDAPVKPDWPLSLHLKQEPFLRGEHWQQQVGLIMTARGWSATQIVDWAKVWFDAVLRKANLFDAGQVPTANHLLDGSFVDAIPRNLIVDPDGVATFFDQEWVFREPIEIGYLLYRGLLLYTFISAEDVAPPQVETPTKVLELFAIVSHSLGVRVTDDDLVRYAGFERNFQFWSAGSQLDSIHDYVCSRSLNILDTFQRVDPSERSDQQQSPGPEPESVVLERDRRFAFLDGEVANLNAMLAERDGSIFSLTRKLADREQELARLAEEVREADIRTEGVIADVRREHAERLRQQCDEVRAHCERQATERFLSERAAIVAETERRLHDIFSEERSQLQLATTQGRERTALLEVALEQQEDKVAGLERSLAQSVATIGRQEEASLAAAARLAVLESSVADHEAIVEALRRDRDRAECEAVDFRRKADQFEALGRILEGQLFERECTISAIQEVSANQRVRITELVEELEFSTSRRADADQELSVNAARLDESSLEVRTALDRCAQLELELKAQTVANRNLSLSFRDARCEIDKLKSSNSWRVTAPLRAMRNSLMTRPPVHLGKLVSDASRRAWHRLPLSTQGKWALKDWVFGNFPGLLGRTRAYLAWRDFRRVSAASTQFEELPSMTTDAIPEPGAEFVPLHAGLPLEEPGTKVICFYLPQFHRIPENDAWWGDGFTEWANVRPARAHFEGQYQPRFPGELGYYDLLAPDTMRRQIELARLYGVGGFCFYFYWFGGKRLLEQPLLAFLGDPALDFPFCLCWANENWSRRWDGLDHEILIEQHHSQEDDLGFIAHVASYLRDPRYIRVAGKPLLLIYRPSQLPSMRDTADRWRTWCRENGIGEIFLAYTQSFDMLAPAEYGLDAAIEFPVTNSAPPDVTHEVLPLHEDFASRVYDWRVFLDRSERYANPPYPTFRTVFPGWDNTPRRRNRSHVMINNSPVGYQQWLLNAIADTAGRASDRDMRMVFVIAWNEWGEGAYLEPDRKYGYAFLEATRMALVRQKAMGQRESAGTPLALVVHAFYPDVLMEILDRVRALEKIRYRLYLTCPPESETEVRRNLARQGFDDFVLLVLPNRGRDVLPFLHIMRQVIAAGHDLVVKIHTKKSAHREDGDDWRRELFDQLLSESSLEQAMAGFAAQPSLGILGPVGHVVPMSYYWGANAARVEALAARLGVAPRVAAGLRFVAGTMFIARTRALHPLLDLSLREDDFETENGQVDGTLAHAVERLVAVSACAASMTVQSIDGVEMDADYAFAERSYESAGGVAPTLPPGFNGESYLAANPDIRESGMPAEEHWLMYGRFEGRPLRPRGRRTFEPKQTAVSN